MNENLSTKFYFYKKYIKVNKRCKKLLTLEMVSGKVLFTTDDKYTEIDLVFSPYNK